jgi:F-type H+-transporting ATPase subunit gamma
VAHPGAAELPRPWEAVFAHLVRERLFATVYLAEAASLAAIEASRLVAMQAAEHNLEERLEDLHERFHRQRQAAITAELLDVIAGAEAVG